MERHLKVVGILTDKYGEEQTVHKTRHGLQRKRERTTPVIEANRAIAVLTAKRIKTLRLMRGWTLIEVAERLRWMSGNPKERVWAIENNNTRGEGVRLGTLYQIARLHGMDVRQLLPSNAQIQLQIRRMRRGSKQ